MRNPRVFVRGFDRPNLYLRVDFFESEDDKLSGLVRRVRFAAKPGIVYVATRKNAESIMGALQEVNVEALFYHAGLRAAERESIQDRFMNGEAEVIVATNAFGMGVDKADVRFVYHYDICASLDNYYQEIGRAGRDGEPAEAVLFYRSQNVGLRKFQTSSGKIDRRQIAAVAGHINRDPGNGSVRAIADATDLSERKVASVLNRLDAAGGIERTTEGKAMPAGDAVPPEAVEAAAEMQDRLKQAQREKLEAMQRYAELTTCRREFLLRYFGDEFEGPCGNCDNDAVVPGRSGAGTRREVSG